MISHFKIDFLLTDISCSLGYYFHFEFPIGKCSEKRVAMESKEIQHEIERKKIRESWLHSHCGLQAANSFPLAGDASFRRYFRINTGERSVILMDAPPQYESCHAYIAIANTLREMGLRTPEIIAADLHQGFLLITDFGDLTYLKALTLENRDQLYQAAL